MAYTEFESEKGMTSLSHWRTDNTILKKLKKTIYTQSNPKALQTFEGPPIMKKNEPIQVF